MPLASGLWGTSTVAVCNYVVSITQGRWVVKSSMPLAGLAFHKSALPICAHPAFAVNLLPFAMEVTGAMTMLARLQSMDEIVKDWIVEILEQHKELLAIAVRQRAKFEGWLKFELAALAEKYGAESVEVEAASSNSTSQRFDLTFLFNGIRYNVELKTPNSNWRMPGVRNRHRPITKNVAAIVRDAQKLYHCLGRGVVAFVLFPIPPHDNRWTKYLNRIASELQISLSEQKHCRRLPLALGNEQFADLLVCSFMVLHH